MAGSRDERAGAIPARITREADRWAVRLSDTRSQRDRLDFEAWVAQDPRHRDAFLASVEALSKGGAASPPEPMHEPMRAPPTVMRKSAVSLAAAAMLVLGVGGVLVVEIRHSGAVHQTLIASTDAASRRVMLADGSRVLLGPDSAIRTDFDGQTRAILLERGSARFIVAHDADYPFVVTAGDRQVTARGTVFDVALAPAGLSVRLIEGVIDVSHKGQEQTATKPVRLKRGQTLVATGTKDQVTPDPTAGAPTATLRSYGATPLATLVAQANAGAAKPIMLEGVGLGALEVQGRFDVSDTAALAGSLAAALDLRLDETAKGFILSPQR